VIPDEARRVPAERHLPPAAAVRGEVVAVDGRPVRYLSAGEGPPLVLLHALGECASVWAWAMPTLARGRRVYAPDLPGLGGDGEAPVGRSSGPFARFVARFLDALGLERAAVVGSSFGGLVALRLALDDPARVGSLGLVSAAGLGRAVSPALVLPTLPGYGEVAVALGKTPLGAAQRVRGRAALLFANPLAAPPEWSAEGIRLARTPGFLEATLSVLRAAVGPGGQREVLLGELPALTTPTLVVWGTRDRVFPASQARDAAARLRDGRLELIPACGHLPHVERPDRFSEILVRFLDEGPDNRSRGKGKDGA
jgi:pimeloyl-ACP methyl ester carboxylesterase